MQKSPVKKIVYSLIVNVIFLCVALFVFQPFFEEIDDTHIAMLSEGAYGVRECHLIYPNVILGKLYVLLNTLIPAFRWHVVIQYMFIFLAYCTVTYVLCKHRYGAVLSFAVISATFYEIYVSLQYTKTASFICAVGLITVFQYVRNCKKLANIDSTISKSYDRTSETARLLKVENIAFVVLSFVFVIYGAMLRKESFFIACVPAVFLGVLELYRTGLFMKYLKVLLPMFIIVVILIVFDSFVYSNDLEWKEFMRYNKARSEFTDYRHDLLYYKMYGEELSAIGVSENDTIVILTYQFGDDNVFSCERLEEIRNHFPKHKAIDVRLFRMLYGNVREEVTKPNVYLYALLLFVVILIVSIIVERSKSNAEYITESRAKLIAMILIGVICAAALFYFHYSGRWSHRLVASLVISAILVIAFMLDNEFLKSDGQTIVFAGNKKDITGRLLIVTIAVSAALNVFMWFNCRRAYAELLADKLNNNSIETLECIKAGNMGYGQEDYGNVLFVADTFTFQNVFKYDIFKPSSVGELKNFVTCGSWFMNSPITRRVTRAFGYENPYEALLARDESVVLLDDVRPDSKLEYLREHYDSMYRFEEIDVVPGATNYAVR